MYSILPARGEKPETDLSPVTRGGVAQLVRAQDS